MRSFSFDGCETFKMNVPLPIRFAIGMPNRETAGIRENVHVWTEENGSQPTKLASD